MRPRTLGAVVERARRDGDWDHHLRDFLDAFYAADGDVVRQAAFVADEPGLLGRPEADAFLGGVGEHLARRWGLPIPGWVRAESRYLATALFVPGDRALRGYLLCVSPVSFRTRLIFTGPDPLQRARFPYHRGVITMPAEHPRGAFSGGAGTGFPKGLPVGGSSGRSPDGSDVGPPQGSALHPQKVPDLLKP